MKIFVAGLPYDLDDAELEEIFEKFGKVVSAKVAMDRETGKSKGFGFVEMPNADEAQKAIDELNGKEFDGRKIVVNESRPRENNDNRPPRRDGGYNRDGGRDGGRGRY